ncbi:acyl carrier protein [compost metagenome]
MNELQAKLRDLIIEELELDLDEIGHLGIDDPLFDQEEDVENYGLDSVDAVELAVLVKRHFNIELSEGDSGAFVTIRALADKIKEKQLINSGN